MRNLKRVLSLALASVMLLGMMVIGASAADKTYADLTDKDEIKNTEAVALMVDLGIIEGKPDGSFAPTETVDRATMAKLITFIMMGDVDADTFAGTATGLKDIDKSWAKGYINYCYANGYITGDGKGSFFPTSKVTVVQAAKMLLVALGYDADDRGYQNNVNWSTNIMKDAQTSGLTNDIDQKATDELTRDNAAQMIYNALFAKTRTATYDRDMGEKYVSGYTVNPTSLGLETYGLAKYTMTVTNSSTSVYASVEPSLVDTAVAADAAGTRVATAVNSTDAGYKFTPDMIAGNITVYVKVDYKLSSDGKAIASYTYKNLYSSEVVKSDTTVLGTSMDGTKLSGATADGATKDLTTKYTKNTKFVAEMQKELNATTGAPTGEYAVKFYLNGTDETASAGVDLTIASFSAPTSITNAMVKGAIVDLIDADDDGYVDIVKVTKKSVATLTSDAATRTSGDTLEVRVPGVTGLSSYVDADTVVGYDGLKKGDVVLYVVIGTVTYIEKAEVVEGVATGSKGTGDGFSLNVDGTYYSASKLVANSPIASWSDWTNTYKFFVDNNKYIVKAEQITDETSNNYAILTGVGKVGSSDSLGSTIALQGQLLFTDGTSEIVTLAKVDGTTVPSTAAGRDALYTTYNTAAKLGKFYTYSVNSDGDYVIKMGTNTALDTTADSGKIVSNSTAKFDGVNVANENTVFLVATTSDNKTVYKTYTGISKVPSITGASVTGAMLKDKGVATFVFVDATSGTIAGVDSDAVYAYVSSVGGQEHFPATSSNPTEYWQVKAYVDGKEETIKVSSSLTIANAVYKFTSMNDNGAYITNGTPEAYATKTTVDNDTANGSAKKGYPVATGGVMSVNGISDVLSYDDSTAVYFIDADKNLSLMSASDLSADKTDVVLPIYDTNKYITQLFVWRVQSNAAVLSAGDVNSNVLTIDESAKTASASVSAAAGTGLTLNTTASDGATVSVSGMPSVMPSTSGNVTVTITVTSENLDVSVNYTLTLTLTVS